MGMPGIWEMLIIGGVIVLLFGAKKLPQLGGAIGESIKNFKKGVADEDKTLEAAKKPSDSHKDSTKDA